MASLVSVIKMIMLLPGGGTGEYTVGENMMIVSHKRSIPPSMDVDLFYELQGDTVHIHRFDNVLDEYNFSKLSIADYGAKWISKGIAYEYTPAEEASNYMGFRVVHYHVTSAGRGMLSGRPTAGSSTQLRVHSLRELFPDFPATPLFKFLPFHEEIPGQPDAPPFVLKAWSDIMGRGYRSVQSLDRIYLLDIPLAQLADWKLRVKKGG